MDLSDGITQEDLNLFLQEADEQLQLLDEDIVRLEKEEDNSDLMQEIFRAAHTLKGSSAMVGHQRMSELAHAMENVLDNVRKGILVVNPQVVDALLHGLDVMRELREEMVSPGENNTDITKAVAELEEAIHTGELADSNSTCTNNQALILEGEAKTRYEESLADGKKGYKINITLDKNTGWTSVRCFQVLQELTEIADILVSVPSQEEIENGKESYQLQLIATSNHTEAYIRKSLKPVEDVENIEISIYQPEEASLLPEKEAVNNEKNRTKKEESKLGQTVRVDVHRLDTLMEQVGELVINRNRLSQISKLLGEKYHDDDLVDDLGDSLGQIAKIISTLQQDVMTIRMLPIEIVFNTLPRMVRDLARKINKKIDFIIEGQETEVDRSIIEQLRDPLVHLLRNAVDHGIESAKERAATGKPETGTVRLSAYQERDNIMIVIQDDGGGINPDTARQAAVKKKLVSPEMATELTDTDAINLIFASGLSTARRVTEVSGRGVGLDVVKTNIETLNGSISVESEIGKGTTFTLMLPLTLAIIPALLVHIGNTICAIPLTNIVETGKLETEDIKTVRSRDVTLFRGSVLPLLRLSEIFGWESDNDERVSDESYFVVVKVADSQVGLVVDKLIEQQELVIKSLDQFAGGDIGITGASILGDGRVVLILDAVSIVRGAVMEYKNTLESEQVLTAIP